MPLSRGATKKGNSKILGKNCEEGHNCVGNMTSRGLDLAVYCKKS